MRADFLVPRDLLAAGRVAEAVRLYLGPLLPSSEAPAVVDQRRVLDQQLRGAVLGGGDPGLPRQWVDAPWGATDLYAWEGLVRVLPPGSPARAAAGARAAALRREPGL